ncbi:MarR family winged helix-turn-helix transcriptional regulator [Georgenia satyanarayanai]|uniref:MarR family winged helix-turn-helix transcriptional regulator n=1 Tax=Georgenia satyanarayanai TaxID=860221 RepID=UPI001263EFEC|nr:MarR family winged helix-turn-helix transcriptional regulator [Georgenia satyanarayanai]
MTENISIDDAERSSTNAKDLRRSPLPRTAAGEASTPYHLVTIGNAISWGSAREYLDRFGIGVNEWRVMAHVANDPGCTATSVSQFLRIDKSVVSRSVKSLIGKGYVGVEPEGGARKIYLTESGVEHHARVLPIALRREEILLTGFTADERAVLMHMLRRMHSNLAAMNEFDHQADRLDPPQGHPPS